MELGQIRTLLRRGTRFRWALARALACLGALLIVVALQLPWAVFTFTSDFGNGPAIAEPVGGSSLPTVLALRFSAGGSAAFRSILYWAELAWYAVPVLAILLALALWQRASARLALVTRWLFRVWLVAMTLFAMLSVWVVLGTASLVDRNAGIQIVRTEVDGGMWLALAALALLWLSVYLMVGEPRPVARAGRLASRRSWRRTRTQLVALGTLLAGLLLWGVGYLALPWATANCAPRLSLTHYVDGPCAGLDSGDTLMAFVSPHLSSSASMSIFASNVLLLAYTLVFGGALLLIAGAGRSAYNRGFCGWVLAWLLAATGMALLSYRGVAAVAANPPFAVGPWHGDLGIVVTFAGLLCAWASLIPLEAAGLAQMAAMREPAHEDAPILAVRAVEP